MESKKVIASFIIIFGLALIITSHLTLNKKTPVFNNPDDTQSIKVNQNSKPYDSSLYDYLLFLKNLSWKTQENSKNFCVYENLNPENDLFPLSLWIRCGEFVLDNNVVKELGGVSLPILVNYPNELSFFDIEKFTSKIPRDGAAYSEDIATIFPKEIQSKIHNYNSEQLGNSLKNKAEQKLKEDALYPTVFITGKIICLTHKNTEGPQTLECAFGIKDNQGKEYGLSDPTMKYLMDISSGNTVTVTGKLKPIESSNYQATETVEIETINN